VRIARAIRDLEQAAGHRLMEVNQAATELLLKGTVADGLPDWDYGRPRPVKFIDFENPANNDFLVINQFKVELTSTRGHVIPDAVLFVNGLPLVVAEFKSPGTQNPLLDLMRNFTVFQQVDGKTRKVVARYQQFRSIHKPVARLQNGRTRAQGAGRDERGGIIWHTQGYGNHNDPESWWDSANVVLS
jgi:type I site-specific restriction-modification system R (restriction) subunit